MSNKLFRILSLVTIVSLLAACGSAEILPDQRAQYKKQKQAEENLEIPPDLTRSSIKDALEIPGAPGTDSATYTEYMEGREKPRQASGSGAVLPRIEKVALRKDGAQRWLEIQAPPEQVWPKIIAFWRENGILLTEQNPDVGIMRTGWIENRADIKRDFITEALRKVVDGFYSAATRDQYRVRLERGDTAAATELYLTHLGMQEKVVTDSSGDPEGTVWEPRPSDPELEAEMLSRIMVYLGVSEERAKRALASEKKVKTPKSQLVKNDTGTLLLLNEDFPRAWRHTGAALDRIGFAVEDRDRSKGVYFVRYHDPLAEEGGDKGFFSKLAFWKSDEKIDTESRFQVKLAEREDGKTQVVVQNDQGERINSPTAQRILTLLHEKIR